uniref:Uncharacterized protein n=1 Tax=Anguilla anguilla TaxID=7936 RepID=A0A0E9R212_ANGAN
MFYLFLCKNNYISFYILLICLLTVTY